MKAESFFAETTEQSIIKTTIVAKYFWAWSKVIIPSAKKSSGAIAYIDLFAGPGRYKNGTSSTPLLVLEKAVHDDDMRQMLVTIFNDKDENNSRSLERAINALPGVDTLRYTPKVYAEEVGDQIVKMFEQKSLVPTLFFVDPWGYRGLSLQLVNSVTKDWGCDCIFFFNYNRINMGLGNQAVVDHMDGLFGKLRADALRHRLTSLGPRESSDAAQGVPSFEYSPADARQPLLFEMSRPLDELQGALLEEFAGQTLAMQKIYQQHNVGRRYIKKNYKDALINLETLEVVSQPI